MVNRTGRVWIGASLGLALGLAVAFHTQPSKSLPAAATPLDQGCINQGQDRRIGATVICWAQRHLSWNSEHGPHFVLIGSTEGTSIGLAWPPYLVYNSPDGSGHWRMFRIGFRYDRNWHGYIFPSVALKRLSNPLRY
jgi:hypothetical protein